MKIRSLGTKFQADRYTGMTNFMVVLRHFSNTPENNESSSVDSTRLDACNALEVVDSNIRFNSHRVDAIQVACREKSVRRAD